MAVWDIVGSILKGTVGEVSNYFIRRTEIRAQEHIQELQLQQAIQERKLDLIKQGLTADENWEALQISNSGWKDEWVLLVLSFPYVIAFCPPLQPVVLSGFNTIGQTPDWYRWLVTLIFTSVYGIRIWRRQKDA